MNREDSAETGISFVYTIKKRSCTGSIMQGERPGTLRLVLDRLLINP